MFHGIAVKFGSVLSIRYEYSVNKSLAENISKDPKVQEFLTAYGSPLAEFIYGGSGRSYDPEIFIPCRHEHKIRYINIQTGKTGYYHVLNTEKDYQDCINDLEKEFLIEYPEWVTLLKELKQLSHFCPVEIGIKNTREKHSRINVYIGTNIPLADFKAKLFPFLTAYSTVSEYDMLLCKKMFEKYQNNSNAVFIGIDYDKHREKKVHFKFYFKYVSINV